MNAPTCERQRELFAHAFEDACRGGQTTVREDDDKLVVPMAGRNVVRSYEIAQDLSEQAQGLVAGFVTEGIVQSLK